MDRVLSDLQPGLGTTAITGELTLTKTGTTARTATFPDAAITVAGLGLAQTWTADQTFDAVSCTTLTASGLLKHEGTQTATVNGDLYGMRIAPTFVEAASGTHPIFAGSYFATPQITTGGATVTDSITCFIQGAPTNGTTNLSLYVFSGESRLRDRVIIGDLTTSSGTVLRVRGPSDTNWGLHLDPAPGLATPYGMLIEENTGASAGYPLLLVSNNGSSTGYLRVDTGGNVTIGTPLATQGITAAADVTLSGNETYVNLSSTYSIGLSIRARMRCVGSGGGSGYGGSLVFDTRQQGNTWNVGALTLSDTGAATFASSVEGPKVKLTPEGGFATLVVADEAISVGHVCAIIQGGTANRVKRCPTSGNENDMPVGVAYSAAGAAGDSFWMVVSGRVGVLPDTGTTAAQGYILTASATTAGLVAQVATAPAAATHFKEIGHFINTGSGAGVITDAIVHFN